MTQMSGGAVDCVSVGSAVLLAGIASLGKYGHHFLITGERKDMPFATFVRNVYECIKEYSYCDAFSLAVFAEGPEALKDGHTGTQEYAVLRDGYARDFFKVMEHYSEFRASDITCKLEESRILPGEVKIIHSCYPKNLRRWMKGTLSRKQKCRAELCALIWCWYDSWLEEIYSGVDMKIVARALMNICDDYTECGDSFDTDVLWDACTGAYWKALSKS